MPRNAKKEETSQDFDTEQLYAPIGGISPEILATPNLSRPKPGSRRPSHDLFECLEHNRLSEQDTRYIFSQVVDAVAFLHSVGVIHRDIKDENVVVNHQLKVLTSISTRLPCP
jgi:serine/threonine protein kinase